MQNQTSETRLGARMTPPTNSRMVRPREMRAMKTPTNGAQLTHHEGPVSQQPPARFDEVVLGQSVQGRDLAMTILRGGSESVLVIGGVHGNEQTSVDVANGLLLVHDRGELGESYLLGGEIATLREVIGRAAALAGHHPPRLTVPSWFLRTIAPVGGLIGTLAGGAPNFGELVGASAGVTYWFSDAKARVELGYAPRDLDTGLRTLLPA